MPGQPLSQVLRWKVLLEVTREKTASILCSLTTPCLNHNMPLRKVKALKKSSISEKSREYCLFSKESEECVDHGCGSRMLLCLGDCLYLLHHVMDMKVVCLLVSSSVVLFLAVHHK